MPPPDQTSLLRRWIEERDEEGLSSAQPGEVATGLVAYLNEVASTYPHVDADRLMSLGLILSLTGNGRCSGDALSAWLLDDPSVGRLDIASRIFDGLWIHVPAAALITPAEVGALLSARRVAPFDAMANASSQLALCNVLRRELASSVREAVTQEIRRAAKDPRVPLAQRLHLDAVLLKAGGA